jgi:signal transduction histidine kinase
MSPEIPDSPDSPAAIARDLAAVARIDAVPALLRVVCETTGMGFAAVARVTEGTWITCAVQDDIGFGLKPGDPLDVNTTLCREVRAAREPVVIDHASEDPQYRNHHTPRMYGLQSYISVPIVRRDGSYFGNLCAIDPRPMKVSDARTLAMFTAFADLISVQFESQARQAEAEWELALERENAEVREQFIAVLGHDLRNPLAAVSVAGDLLALRSEPELVALGGRIRANTRRMAQLIEDVMDLARSRLGSGIGIAPEEQTEVATALRDVIDELRDANPDRAVDSHIAIDAPVRCDLGRVQQLLSNLLGNALTYGAPDRPVQVDAVLYEGTLAISVTNQGEPIPPETLARVFEPYWRPAHSRRGGLGLGLYICAQIAKAHGGDITVTSSRSEGTRFTARLPV